jgi:ABC-type uncharacterized transport system permease subunit
MTDIKKRIASALGGAVATGVIPLGYGCWDYRVIVGCAVAGGIGGFLHVNVAARIKRMLPRKKPVNT